MLKKLEYVCLVGSIALIGADRIDLFGGYGFFRLTPFLFFASLVVLIRLFCRGIARKISGCDRPAFSSPNPFSRRVSTFLVYFVHFNHFRFGPGAGTGGSLWFGACVRLGILRFSEDIGRSCTRKVGGTLRHVCLDRMADFLHWRVHRLESWGHRVCRKKPVRRSNPCLRPLQHYFGYLGCRASAWMQTAPASSW